MALEVMMAEPIGLAVDRKETRSVFGDIRVLDFSSGMAGALATMLLADYGADVVKIEPPRGDPCWRLPAYRQWQRGKRSARLDLKSAEGRGRARELAARADVIVTSFRPGVAERLGLDFEGLAADNPRLVYCAITGFGPNGPYRDYRGYEGIVAAKAGRMTDFAGQVPRPGPVFTAVPIASYGAAQLAVQGMAAALFVRERTGRGQRVETSLVQALTTYDFFGFLATQLHRRDPRRYPLGGPDTGIPAGAYLVARTRDRHWLQFANINDRLFRAFLEAIDRAALLEDPRFRTAPVVTDPEAQQALWKALLARIVEEPLAFWLERFARAPDVAVEPLITTQEALRHPQLLHNGNVIRLEDPRRGDSTQVGPLAWCSQTPARIGRPAPRSGEHTRALLRDLTTAPRPQPEPPGEARESPAHPLTGVTLIELATYYAGPFGLTLLAELGARVIKIEALEGDPVRNFMLDGPITMHGKESLALDLKRPEGREILHALLARADGLMHNFRPGVPERLGFDWETARRLNPEIVYLDALAYGLTGPSALRPAMHPIAGAAAGGARAQAGSGCPPPAKRPLSLDAIQEYSRQLYRANEGNPDPNSALGVATAMLLGLLARRRFGVGQRLITTMIGSNAHTNSEDFLNYAGKPARRLADRGLYGLDALYRLYPTADGWLFLACPSDQEWQGLCRALGREEWLRDPRFRTAGGRRRAGATLGRRIGEILKTRSAAAWERRLGEQDVAAVEVCPTGLGTFTVEDAGMHANGFVAEARHPRHGAYLRHGPTIVFSETPSRMADSCLIGQHSRAILEELGFSAQAIDRLGQSGVVAWPDMAVVAGLSSG
jgi:crotonobetainyl-CoA:carnitine CoA-transferase CaiB-like acyl-CoA transferase